MKAVVRSSLSKCILGLGVLFATAMAQAAPDNSSLIQEWNKLPEAQKRDAQKLDPTDQTLATPTTLLVVGAFAAINATTLGGLLEEMPAAKPIPDESFDY